MIHYRQSNYVIGKFELCRQALLHTIKNNVLMNVDITIQLYIYKYF